VAQLMDRYVEVTDWDLSPRKANEVPMPAKSASSCCR